MVFIHDGFGWLVPATVFGVSLAANLIFNATHGEGFYDDQKWPFAMSLVVSGTVCWYAGCALRKRADRVVIDRETGREFVINQSKHTFFFIPMHLWGVGLTLAGIALFVVAEVDARKRAGPATAPAIRLPSSTR